MEGWDALSAVLLGSPQTAAGEQVRIDSANDDDVYPFVVGHRVDVKRAYGLDNTLLEHQETYQLECWGETREQAGDMADEVAQRLQAAGFPLDPQGPDGLDPIVDVRCAVLYVSLWLDVGYIGD